MIKLVTNSVESWSDCKNLLCIRPDNLGDLLMSSPAIRALKESFGCRITLLTSSMAAPVAALLDSIDEVIVYDLPWVKLSMSENNDAVLDVINEIKNRQFDGAIIFTVYSQNPLPTAMLTYLAGVPKTLAYCRENPYELLTHWCPDKEPYTVIKHQVRRDLDLVAVIGAKTEHERLSINLSSTDWSAISKKMQALGVDPSRRWIILHAGVSEEKRRFNEKGWIQIGRTLAAEGINIILTGTKTERHLTERIRDEIGSSAYTLAGDCSLAEFASLIQHAPLVISVNTSTVHLAAATGTPVIVLYALTNPQHLPWKVPGRYFAFDIPQQARSSNEVIRYVHDHVQTKPPEKFSHKEVCEAALRLLSQKINGEFIPEMIV